MRFGSFEDRDEVLYSWPYMLGNKPIIVKTCLPYFDLNKEIMQTTPIWVKFPFIPLNYWGIQSLSRSCSGLGIPLFADECTTQVDRVSYARVLIEMDISQKLPADIKVEDPNGKEFNQKVVYEWVPAYCPKGEQQREPIKTSDNSGLVELEEEIASPRQERVNQHEGQGIRNVQEGREQEGEQLQAKENVEKWEEARADMGKGFEGAAKVTGKDKRSLWEQLRRIHNNQQTPWVAMGDYNTIHRGEDRMIGSPVTDAEIRDFDDYLRDTNITILKHIGRDFTWTNGYTYSRIDWALVNTRWMLTMLGMEVQILDPGCSDHSPLSINFVQQVELRSRHFKLLNHLVKHEKFQETVKQAWQESVGKTNMLRVWRKLKRVKQALKNLNTTEFQGVEARIKKYREQIQDLQGNMGILGQPTSLIEAKRDAKLNLEKWLNVEENIIRQKCRVQWLKLGDGNTACFHASLRNRLAQNKIASLTNATGNIVTNTKDVEDEILGFYKSLLGTCVPQLPAMDGQAMKDGPRLDRGQQAQLIAHVSREEIV
ncbi:hypothetical protein KY290_007546 [Solanum tuberosum]|uniref:DUF4283 domain-containing protein n=1 Tax=Solanum tuberosum TaxID=4113 RepID=A0ABQ7W6C7_SOLTU|nr:hypothetical protein KY290_007546 [Solanum tuberosum]